MSSGISAAHAALRSTDIANIWSLHRQDPKVSSSLKPRSKRKRMIDDNPAYPGSRTVLNLIMNEVGGDENTELVSCTNVIYSKYIPIRIHK